MNPPEPTPDIPLGEHGIPQCMWDECNEAQKTLYSRQVAEMPEGQRVNFVQSLVNGRRRALAAFGPDTATSEGRRAVSEHESNSTTIGTALALESMLATETRLFGSPLT